MCTNEAHEANRYSLLSKVGRIGWWEADFETWQFETSDYLAKLLGLKNNTMTFQEFGSMIREDYRERIGREFLSIQEVEVYEQTFPIYSTQDIVWVRSTLGEKRKTEDGRLVIFGVMQLVDMPASEGTEELLTQSNDFLFRQHSISRTLRHFLKEQEQQESIRDVLRDLLDYFRAGRVYLFEYAQEHTIQNCVYEVVAQGVAPEIDSLQSIECAQVAWWTNRILNDMPILLDHITDLPEEAVAEYEMLSSQSIKSLMVIPLQGNNGVWGYIGIDLVDRYYHWTNEDYQWFSSLSNIISICINLRRANDEVVRDRGFLSNLYHYMPIGYSRLSILYDKEGKPYDYLVVDSNKFGADLCGSSLDEYLGHRAHEFLDEELARKNLEALLNILRKDKYRELELNFEKTGKCCHCIIYSPEPDEVVCLFMDITESRQAYAALDRSEKLLRNIFTNIPVGVEVYDKDGYLKDLNNKDLEIFGVNDINDVLGVNFFNNPNVPAELAERIRNEDVVDFSLFYGFENIDNYYHSGRNGNIELYSKMSKIYSSKGEFIGYMLINIDNTERISSLNRIRDFEHFFLLISEYAKVGYAKLNMLSRKGYAIKQWYKNMGEDENTPLSEVVGVYGKVHPEDRTLLLEFFDRVQEGKEKDFRRELRVYDTESPDNWKWMRVNIVVTCYEPENDLIEIIGINYDITELKEAEKELIEAKEKAETADRLKSAFLANMSHEIRTPLNAIVGFSSLLWETEDREEQREYIKIVEENNALLLQLISDILDLSKIEAGTFDFNYRRLSVNLLCEDVARSMQIRMNEGVKLMVSPLPEDCFLYSDSGRLHQVLSNFVNNAIKFTSQGTICIGCDKPDEEHLRIYVKDTGIGIDPARCEQVFERFIKLNSFVQGTGLGLSICRSIIEQLGGQIGVDSRLGEGSCFWFILPINGVEIQVKERETGV